MYLLDILGSAEVANTAGAIDLISWIVIKDIFLIGGESTYNTINLRLGWKVP